MSDSTTSVSSDSAFGHHHNRSNERQNRKLFMLVSACVCSCWILSKHSSWYEMFTFNWWKRTTVNKRWGMIDRLANFFVCNARKSESWQFGEVRWMSRPASRFETFWFSLLLSVYVPHSDMNKELLLTVCIQLAPIATKNGQLAQVDRIVIPQLFQAMIAANL